MRTDKDMANNAAWAELITDVLHLLPPSQRAEILALATQKEEAAKVKREASGWIDWDIVDFTEHKSLGVRHRTALARLKSLVVQVFVRDIANGHSRPDAAKILFAPQRHGTGSGRLSDYLLALQQDRG
jgi:hypothetical protein